MAVPPVSEKKSLAARESEAHPAGRRLKSLRHRHH
jgi:hypothetical protein